MFIVLNVSYQGTRDTEIFLEMTRNDTYIYLHCTTNCYYYTVPAVSGCSAAVVTLVLQQRQGLARGRGVEAAGQYSEDTRTQPQSWGHSHPGTRY